MICPKCGGNVSVTDTLTSHENEMFRRRRCVECSHRFFTIEFEVIADPKFESDWKSLMSERDKARRERLIKNRRKLIEERKERKS